MLDDSFLQETEGTMNRKDKDEEKTDHLFKVLVIGEWAVGKTCYVRRYVHSTFTTLYKATIGVDFALKTINWDENTTIRLQLWDIQGQEYYGSMTRAYYRDALGAIVVFDATRPKTFEEVAKWKSDLDEKVQLPDGSRIPAVLIANKCDIAQRDSIIHDQNALDRFCSEHGFRAWFACSAKENIRVDESVRFLIAQILEQQRTVDGGNTEADQAILRLRDQTTNDSPGESRSRCFC